MKRVSRGIRETLPGDALVLAVSGRTGPPPLRFERADGGRWLLRQGERPLLVGRLTDGGCCPDLRLRRLDGYRSPLPPLTAAAQRARTAWAHHCARLLEEAPHGPLHDGRWHLRRRTAFEPGVWGEDYVTTWPDAELGLWCAGGWHGVLPLRPLSPPDAPRVKAYRRHAREGSLAPVLLWWVSFLDGWLILDGHDRAVAALAEGAEPVCVELVRAPDEADSRRTLAEVTEAHEQLMARLDARPPHPGHAAQRAALERGYADALGSLPYEPEGTRVWPLPGGAPAWDVLAARAMLECPGD
ncbi:hypothetical protein [Streptomyces sp. Ru71]|uniref:hypothetical protein n=1 Tax=Streptomyces sp. Ru71 TaxID=2080746 RepID=UPI0021561013|nr:hypothetical protein [Streptomyces sp. Ru71]